MTSSTNNLFDGNWYIGTYQQLPADEKAHTVNLSEGGAGCGPEWV